MGKTQVPNDSDPASNIRSKLLINKLIRGWVSFPPRSGQALMALALLAGIIYPAKAGIILADFEPDSPANVQSTIPTALSSVPSVKNVSIKTRKVKVTAYTSSPEETDDTPFITASGKTVRDGIVASNFLPMGTKIKIPAFYGDKIFVVEDRMHPRMTNVVDVWMENKSDALQFGARHTEIAILD